MYRHYKQGQATQEDCRDAVHHCRKKVHVAKAQVEFQLASTLKDNKKGFLKYAKSKRRIRDNIGPLLDKVSHVQIGTKTKQRSLPLSSTLTMGPGALLCWKTVTGGDDKLPANSEVFWDLPFQLDAHNFGGLRRFVLGCWKSWATLSPGLSLLFLNGLGSTERSSELEAGKCCPIFKKGKKDDPGNYMPVTLTGVPGKIMEKVTLGLSEKHSRDNAVVGHSQHRFTRGKSCLTNLISF